MIDLLSKLKLLPIHPMKAWKYLNLRVKERLFWEDYYQVLRKPKKKSRITHNAQINTEILNQLNASNLIIKNFKPNLSDFINYLRYAEYHQFQEYYNGGHAYNFIEKAFEHYLAAKLLDLTNEDIYIDIANCNSPVPEIYHKLYSCKTYRQDLMFPEGIHGNKIGGDAGNMPIEDGFATKMALHCSFEHFELNSDINLIKESNRVLRTGGKLCILPLYLLNHYALQINPIEWPTANRDLERDAILYCVMGWGTRHARFYDIPHLLSRIGENLGTLKLTIYVVQSTGILAQKTHVKYIAFFEKK